VRYLDTTLKSLSASVPSQTPIFIMNDGTKNESMIRYLTTNEIISINDYEYPNYNDEWKYFIGYLPNEKQVRGIKGKAYVLMRNPGGISNIGYACKKAFDETGSSHVIKIEDDMIFKKGWYDYLCLTLLKTNGLGIVSGLRYFYGNYKVDHLNDKLDILSSGYTGGNLLTASRMLLNKQPNIFINDITEILHNDDFWINSCRKAGLIVAVTKKSICQHIGVITEAKHKEYMQGDKIIKIDRTIVKPFEIQKEVTINCK